MRAVLRLMTSLLLVMLEVGQQTRGDLQPYVVAGLFEKNNEALERAFSYAITKMNIDQVLGSSRIVDQVERTSPGDSFEANKKVCRLMKAGIAGVFGYLSEIPRAHVQSLCNAFEIPHVLAQWDAREHRDYYSINVFPDSTMLSRAYADLIRYWNWKRFTVIYQDNESLVRLQEILWAARGEGYQVTVRELDPRGNYISMLKDIKEKQEYRIIIDCDTSKIRRLLQQAKNVTLLSEYYHYHFTTMDLMTIELKEFRYERANITSMTLIDPSSELVRNVKEDWMIRETSSGRSPLMGKKTITTDTAMIYDAVNLFSRALGQLAHAQHVNTEKLSCSKKDTWKHGNSLLNYMKAMNFEGLTGRIRFDQLNGKRLDFRMIIVEVLETGMKTVGYWTPLYGVNITATYTKEHEEELSVQLKNKTLRVVTVYDEPYVMLRNEPDENGRVHEGFIIDLLDNLSAILGFNYTIYEQREKAYGNALKNGLWNGLVGDLMERDIKKRADVAAAGMTITYAREQVVDFTKPFLNLGITIVFKKPTKPPPDLFSFLSPLSLDVWIYMIAAYLCISFMLFVIARFSPYEWTNPHPCDQESDEVENQFTILNSLWFTIGSLMQQGCEIAPKAISTRSVSVVWWFFTMILISSYTANLAAFLTVKRMAAPITDADDLSNQQEIEYGTLKSGSTRNFFENSNVTVYKRLWSFMSSNEDKLLVDNNTAGFERVKKHNYAYLAESTTIDYQVQRNCELMQIGDLLDSKGYGLATPKDSPWLDMISRRIIQLQEDQVIQKLYNKWWKDKVKVKCEKSDKKDVMSLALGFESVGGVFVLLMGGLVAGFIVSILEFLWKAWKNASADKQSFCSEVTEEMRFILKCKSTRSMAEGPSDKEAADNGVTFVPLSTLPNNKNAPEVYT